MSLLFAALLGVTPANQTPAVRLVPWFEVRTSEPDAGARLDSAQAKLVATYQALLAAGPFASRRAEGLQFARVEQSLIPVSLVRASGWSDGGHRLLHPILFAVESGELRVVRAHAENLDEDGYHRAFSKYRACAPELTAKVQALLEQSTPDFEKRYEALESSWCRPLPLTESIEAARKARKVDAAWLKRLISLLAVLANASEGARVVTSARQVGDSKLTALLEGESTHQARWVGSSAKVAAFSHDGATVSASGALVEQESSLTSWLMSFELEYDPSTGPRLVLKSLAHSITYIE